MSFDQFTALATLTQAGAQIGTGVIAQSAANQEAKRAEEAAKLVRADELRKGKILAGKQRAAFGKSGVAINVGTPLDVLAQTAMDAETNAVRAALFFERQAENLRSAGKIALTKGILGAGTTILGKFETFRDLFPDGSPTHIPVVTVGSPSTATIRTAGTFA